MLRMKSDLVESKAPPPATANWTRKPPSGTNARLVGRGDAAGGYPGNYNTGDEIHGSAAEGAADGARVSTRRNQTADDNRVLTSGGRVLCATALGNTVAEAQKARLRPGMMRYQLGTAAFRP